MSPDVRGRTPKQGAEPSLERQKEQPRLADIAERIDLLPFLQKVILSKWHGEFNVSDFHFKAGRVPEENVQILIHLLVEEARATPSELASLLPWMTYLQTARLLDKAINKNSGTKNSRFHIRSSYIRQKVLAELEKQNQKQKRKAELRDVLLAQDKSPISSKATEAEQERIFTFEEIKKAVESVSHFSSDSIIEKDVPGARDKDISNARDILVYLTYCLLQDNDGLVTQEYIARLMRRDHSTVKNSINNVSAAIEKHNPNDLSFQVLAETCQQLGVDIETLAPIQKRRALEHLKKI